MSQFPEPRPPGPAVQGQTRWIVLAFLWIAFLINNVDRQIVFSIFPLLTQQLHFSRVQLGLVGSVFLWTYCASTPFTGRVADVIQRERLIVVSTILWSVATLGTAWSYSVGYFLVWRGAVGLAESLYTPAALGLIAGWHPAETRATAIALHATSQFGGLALGGWAGGFAAETIGWRPGFSLLATVGILYAGVLALMFPRTSIPLEERHTANSHPLEVFRSRCFLALLLAYTLFMSMVCIFYNWLPEFVFTKFHLSLAESGLVATAYLQGGSVVGVVAWGFLGDFIAARIRPGRYYLIAGILIACAPLAKLILSVNSLAGLKLASTCFGFFAGGVSASVVVAAFDVNAMKNYGFTSGIINLCAGIGGGIGVLLVGWTNNPNGEAGVIKWAALAVVAGAVLVAGVTLRRYTFERDAAWSGG